MHSLGENTYTDTISIRRIRKNTYVITSETDTLFQGDIAKKKGMYFLSRKEPNGYWSIGAFRIKGDSVYNFHDAITASHPGMRWFSKFTKKESKEYIIYTIDNSSQETVQAFAEVVELETKGEYFEKIKSAERERNTERGIEQDEAPRNASFSAYPNPFTQVITVRQEKYSEWQLRMINASGQIMKEASFTGTAFEWDLSSLPHGTYILEARTKDGIRQAIKLLKQ
jgi:hypothetical protein